jgi:rsbT antagonist protein RsbS
VHPRCVLLAVQSSASTGRDAGFDPAAGQLSDRLVHEALNDREIVQFQQDVVEQIGTHRARGIIIDVAALDVMDSFGSRTLLNLARAARLRGAETVIVGIQPSVAFAMVRLGIGLDNVHTALDLEEGLAYLQRLLLSQARPWERMV